MSNQGTTYYVAANGRSKQGTSMEQPMSFEEANKKTYKENDKILFKKGDTFYGQLNFNIKASPEQLCYIGSYGEGNRPIISEAKILDDKNVLQLKKGTKDIYEVNISNKHNFKGIDLTSESSCNIGFIRDSENNIYADRKQKIELLEKELDFYCDDTKIYIKCEKNPIEKYKKLILAPRIMAVRLSSNTTMDGIKIENTGAHGIVMRGNSLKNTIIKNCVIDGIGGSLLSKSKFVRYGNGIQFYLGGGNTKVENVIVENNIIKNVFDTAVTAQGTVGIWSHIIIRDNIFIKNCFSYEFFSVEKAEGMKDICIYNNISINQGRCWGQLVRSNPNNSAELIIRTFTSKYMEFDIHYNKYYNPIRMYYVLYKTKERFKEEMKIDHEIFRIQKGTYVGNDYYKATENPEDTRKYLVEEYHIDEHAEIKILNEEEVEKISNEQILASEDYDTIKNYYEEIEKNITVEHFDTLK